MDLNNNNNFVLEVFCIDEMTVEEYEKYYFLLSEQKKKRVDAYKFKRDKRLSVCGEMLAKKMIAKHCSEVPENAEILTDSNGKPYVRIPGIEFNISHSGDMVACALSDMPIGVDIEKMREIDDKLIEFVCTDDEKKYVFENDETKQKRFFEIWTAKEAFFKCDGSGISDLKSINVLDDEFKSHLQTKFTDDYAISVYQ